MLSLDNKGSSHFGPYVIVLRDPMIEHRSTVFEENSVIFFKNRSDVNVGNPPPPGYRAPWSMRDVLAMAKCHDRIDSITTAADFPHILVRRGSSPEDEDFVEVHVYGPVHRSAVEKVVGPQPTRGADRTLFASLKTTLRKIGASLEIL